MVSAMRRMNQRTGSCKNFLEAVNSRPSWSEGCAKDPKIAGGSRLLLGFRVKGGVQGVGV